MLTAKGLMVDRRTEELRRSFESYGDVTRAHLSEASNRQESSDRNPG